MNNEMVQNVVSRMALTSKSGGMPPPPKAGKGGGKGPDPLAKYPTGCTLVVDGIPYNTNEHMYLPALVSCYGKWKVPNENVIAVNIPRSANHIAGESETYVNRGHVFLRFSEQKYMKELQSMIDEQDQFVECDVKWKVRYKIRCRVAERDLGSKDLFKVNVPVLERARYFDDVFLCYRMN